MSNDAIKKIRDEWVANRPDIYELLDTSISNHYLSQIIRTEKFSKFKNAFQNNAKVLATRLLHKHGRLILKENGKIEAQLLAKIKEMWIKSLQQRAMKVVLPIHSAIIFDEKLNQFITDRQSTLNCTLLPKPEIAKIIPHLPLIKLHKVGRLRGELFDYKVKWWFFSKEDAEKISIEETEHIAKYRLFAQDKAHRKMVEDNIDRINDIIWHRLDGEGYEVSIGSDDFYLFANKILNMRSVKQLISSASMAETSLGLPVDASIQLENLFIEKMKTDKNFSSKLESELKRRKDDFLEIQKELEVNSLEN